MTKEAQLRALVGGRALSTEEQAMVVARNDAGLAASLSVGRKRVQSRMISERGVMAALGTIDGEACLQAFEDFAASDLAEGHPLKANHKGIKRMLSWLKSDAGLDIGTAEAHQMLGAMANPAIDVIQPEWAEVLTELTKVDDPVHMNTVSEILNGE